MGGVRPERDDSGDDVLGREDRLLWRQWCSGVDSVDGCGNKKNVNNCARFAEFFVYLVHSSAARSVAARIRKVVGRFYSLCFVLSSIATKD